MNTAPEILEIRALAREFAAAELRPHTEAWDAHGSIDDALLPKLAELGFFGMLVPEAAGGMGFDVATYTAALEELAWGEAGAALLVADTVIAADIIAQHATASTKDEWLPRLASGESTACLALGHELADAPSTVTAQQTGDTVALSGTARLVVNGERAALALVRAGSDRGAVSYVVPRAAGYQAGARATTLGLRTVPIVDLHFDGARIAPTTALATTPHAETSTARLSAAAIAVGIAQAALDHAVAYANVREQFGQPIRNFEGIQHKLAEMATRIAAARALVQRAAADAANNAAGAMAKLAAGSCAMYVTTEAVQIFGGYGYMRDYPVEKLMRDAKAMELLHGSNETQRQRIAEWLYP